MNNRNVAGTVNNIVSGYISLALAALNTAWCDLFIISTNLYYCNSLCCSSKMVLHKQIFLFRKRSILLLLGLVIALIIIWKKKCEEHSQKLPGFDIVPTKINSRTSHKNVERTLDTPPLLKRANQTTKCNKKYQNQTYKVCEELPYLDVKCGPKYSQNKPKQDQPYIVPDVIFFIWFGANRTFKFFHYISIRSAAAIHQPERIDFYFDHLPIGTVKI